MNPNKKDTIVVALGGNALINKGEIGTAKEHITNLHVPIRQIAELSNEHNVIITHGNGPQIGFLLEQQQSDHNPKNPKMPVDTLVAETQGQIGYFIEQVLEEELDELGTIQDRFFLTILSYVNVDINDPAFSEAPTKPIGPYLTKEEVQVLLDPESPEYKLMDLNIENKVIQTPNGVFREIQPNRYRKAVFSPLPKSILQSGEIKKIIDSQENSIIVTCGGGGIPVVRDFHNGHRRISGVEAVIDKDLASAVLAQEIAATTLIIVTNVDKVSLNFGKPNQIDLDTLTIAEAKQYLDEGHFGVGSMLTKVQACVNFLETGGQRALITSTEHITDAINGKGGTEILKKPELVLA